MNGTFTGQIADIQIHPSRLTNEQIVNLYNNGTTVTELLYTSGAGFTFVNPPCQTATLYGPDRRVGDIHCPRTSLTPRSRDITA